MRKRLVVLSLAGLVVLGLALARLSRGPLPDYKPLDFPSALDQWKAPWEIAPPAAAATLPKKWIVMGWDGASWDVVLPLIEAGKLPNLARLMREGAYAKLLTAVPTQSAAVWTSIATGTTPARHGIEGFAKKPKGIDAFFASWGRRKRVELYSNADRRVKALWNLASENGKRVLVSGYHNTFPAEKVSGVMVSNYVVREGTLHVIPGAAADAPEGVAAHLAFPPAVLQRILPLATRPEDLSWEQVKRFAAIDEQRFRARIQRFRKAPHADARWEYLLKACAYDTFHAKVAVALRAEVDPDILMVHFQGPDWAGHHFFYFHWPERYARFPRSQELHDRLDRELPFYRGTVTAFYDYADEWLGRLMECRSADTAVMVLSDHGMDVQDYWRETGFHNAAPPGILVMSGPGIARGVRLSRASLYDILPTLMASLSLPVAQDLEGRPLASAFEPGLFEHVQSVASYETGARYVPDVPLGSDFHDELEKELRGLGYIQ